MSPRRGDGSRRPGRPRRPAGSGGSGRSGGAGGAGRPGRRAVPGGARGRGRDGGQPRPTAGPRGVGGELVEGRHAVRELLLAGRRRTRDVWMADDLDEAPILGDIVELAAELRVPVRRVGRDALEAEARSDAPQGVLAHAAALPVAELDSVCRHPSPPFLLALDSITDPGNLGALLRTALSAGATGAVLPRHRSAHISPTVAKAAAGAVEHLPLAMAPGIPNALARARDLGLWVVGLDAAGDRPVFDLPLATEPLVLVVGAEGSGLSRLTRQRCDVLASIPLAGPLPSLNVAAAAAIACFEIARRRAI